MQENILAILHTENIPSREQLISTFSWINIDLVRYLDTREATNLSFSFLTDSIQNISKFDIKLKIHKRELKKFKEGEKKILQFNFAIDLIKG